MSNRIVYLSVSIDPDRLMSESIKVLPGVSSFERFYPDDPALHNIYILHCNISDAEHVFDTVSNVDGVLYVEYTDKPEIRS